MARATRWAWALLGAATFTLTSLAGAQTVTVDKSAREQVIDGFGTCLSGDVGESQWFQDLFLSDLEASIVRFDITPRFASPYSDHTYNCPWYGNDPALPGPDGNNVRTYTGAADYGRSFAGRSAPIAVMGPNIDQNLKLFDYTDARPRVAGKIAQLGASKKAVLGDFKLIASMWSPAPWLKITSGNKFSIGTLAPQTFPADGTPWPFIWAGNFAGGKLDVSNTPLPQFDDSSLGGSGPTSALTQFARTLAAYLRGFQKQFGVSIYAISIQNELNFEEFYDSADYPLSSGYIAALKVARAELDKYPDLATIRIMGPEDLLGGDAWGMWQYGGGASVTHKNLQYLDNIAADSTASAAIDHFCIHGYAPDGVTSAGADPTSWHWWADGWTTAPANGLPQTAAGFTSYKKKSWMTETSGEDSAWLSGTGALPANGGFGVAIKIHQALTAGRESAWVYWQLSDGSTVGNYTLTDQTSGANAPKYVAAKHFFRYIRPNSYRVDATVTGSTTLLASAYVNDRDGTLTVVLINTDAAATTATLALPADAGGIGSFDVRTSSDGAYWKASTLTYASSVSVPVPRYGVVTLFGDGTDRPDAGPPPDNSSDAATDSGAPPTKDSGAQGGSGGGDGGAVASHAASGCGCRSAGGRPEAGAAMLAALLAMAFGRRSRRTSTQSG